MPLDTAPLAVPDPAKAWASSAIMAAAIGASCAFLTPIGHQNYTLILGPGGFLCGEYWKLALVLEALSVAVSVPLIVLVWGL